MKKLFFIPFLSSLLFSASSEQIEQYLTVSKADAQLVAIEQVFDSMRQNQEREDNNTQEINQSYRGYLEEHLSSNEVEKLLELYRTPIMQRYVVEMDMGEIPRSEMQNFLKTIEEEPLSTERLDIIEDILEHTIDDKQILAFYKSMTQRYQKKSDKERDKNSTKEPTKEEQRYLDMMKQGTRDSLLYGTQVFSIEEMKELDNALKSTILSKASKVESQAMVHVMNGFIQGITSKPKDSNSTTK
jgi:hypothetical protein